MPSSLAIQNSEAQIRRAVLSSLTTITPRKPPLVTGKGKPNSKSVEDFGTGV
jgi:hypothetical protein